MGAYSYLLFAFGVRTDIPWTRVNVRYWHKADIEDTFGACNQDTT